MQMLPSLFLLRKKKLNNRHGSESIGGKFPKNTRARQTRERIFVRIHLKKLGIENRSGGIAADDVYLADAALEGALCGFQLQNHAAGDHAGMHEALDLPARDRGEDFFAVQDAGDVREIDEMVGANKFGGGGGHVIGIDIVE